MKSQMRFDSPARKYMLGLFKDKKYLKGSDDRADILSQYFEGDLKIALVDCSSEDYHIGLDDFSRSHKIGYELNFLDEAKPALFEKFKTKEFGVIDVMYKRYKKEALHESNDALFGRPSRNLKILSERYKNLFTKGLFPSQITKGSETRKKNQEQESF